MKKPSGVGAPEGFESFRPDETLLGPRPLLIDDGNGDAGHDRLRAQITRALRRHPRAGDSGSHGQGDLEKNATARFSADRGLFVKRENEEPSEATGPVGSAACRSMAAVR
jgi:hypothetical protein